MRKDQLRTGNLLLRFNGRDDLKNDQRQLGRGMITADQWRLMAFGLALLPAGEIREFPLPG
jgi:hypothetical protein